MIDAKAGATYYLRLDTEDGGARVKDPILRIAFEEDAKTAMQLMEPVKESDVKDKSVVLTSYPDHPAGQEKGSRKGRGRENRSHPTHTHRRANLAIDVTNKLVLMTLDAFVL